MVKIAPSILSADFARLKEDIDRLENNYDYLHIDVMDGLFVNNISIGIPVIKSLRPYCKSVFDTHLMIVEPERYIEAFAKAGADIITFHVEATNNPLEVINLIHQYGKKAGISLRPKTDISALVPYLDKVELVLVMSVEPGFGGQKFDPSALAKIEFLSNYKKEKDLNYEIEVDGGINGETAPLCKEIGIEILVSGSYIFNSDNPKQKIESLK